ncbi:hypothetical protein ACFV6Y_38475 [Streptomyces massasporeus]|uniref:hypothetical protein n=1 Tax=Streptomyces massasporeus TaxID=67324 RepID=UPI00364FACF9
MAAGDRRRCPVCWRTVYPTFELRNVIRHRDSIDRDVCPMSGEPFALAEPWRPTRKPVSLGIAA